MAELKPCPFCGGKAEMKPCPFCDWKAEMKPCPFCGAELERRSDKRGRIVYMHPSNGCIFLKAFLSNDEDFMEWNRRADDGNI